MNEIQKGLYTQLEEKLDTTILTYITGDRQGFEAQIASDVIDIFVKQLNKISPDGKKEKISLILYTRGGDLATAWNIVHLIRQYCKNFHVIIPYKAHSTGTLISIGANSIMMTKQATLSPIDPSVNTPLNPDLEQSGSKYPVSVEAVKGYLEFATKELNIKDDMALANILISLSDKVHPLVLGQVYRSQGQIQMLAKKLLINQVKETEKINSIISFLCRDSGSHDYTINRREARDLLGLKIDKIDDETYNLINSIYSNIEGEFLLQEPYNMNKILMEQKEKGFYSVKRALVESIVEGSDYFVSDIHYNEKDGNIKNAEMRWLHE